MIKASKQYDMWEKLYNSKLSYMQYPDSNFLTYSHRLLKLDEHRKVLDYGFGYGSNMLSMLKRGFDVSGVEVSQSAINIVNERLKKERLSAKLKLIKGPKLPFNDNAFDVVIAWQVLDYNTWNSLELAVEEIDRVLRPGGFFMGTMTSIDDGLCYQSKKLGNCLYKIKSSGQKDFVKMAFDRKHLIKCFPSRKISIGKFGFGYKDIKHWHWFITYEKD